MDAKDLEHYELAHAVQKLATLAIESQAAFGMTFGYEADAEHDIAWDAGASADELAYPKHKSLAALSLRDMAATLTGVLYTLEPLVNKDDRP